MHDTLEIDPGRFRQRVTIQFATKGDDDLTTHTTGPTVWAEVIPLRGDEQIAARQKIALTWYKVRLRYRTDITALDRLVWDGMHLEIGSITRVDGRTAYLELLCTELSGSD